MINPKFCRICKNGKVEEPRYNERDLRCCGVAIFCEIDDDGIVYMNDNPPRGCPYILEHKISMQGAREEEIDLLYEEEHERNDYE